MDIPDEDSTKCSTRTNRTKLNQDVEGIVKNRDSYLLCLGCERDRVQHGVDLVETAQRGAPTEALAI